MRVNLKYLQKLYQKSCVDDIVREENPIENLVVETDYLLMFISYTLHRCFSKKMCITGDILR